MDRRRLLGAAAAGIGTAAVLDLGRANATGGQSSVCHARLVVTPALSDRLYLVGRNGNRIAWDGYDLTIPGTWMSITNAGLAPNTLYYVYVWGGADGVPHLEFSTTGHAPNSTWNECKIGDPSRLLLGMVFTDALRRFVADIGNGKLLVLNWHNRMPMFVAPVAAGAVCGPGPWQELGSTSLNLVEFLTWGYQLGVAESFTLGVSGAACVHADNGRLDLVFGDLALGPELAVSSWIVVTSAKAGQWQNVSGASTMGFPEGRHVTTFWAHTDGAPGSIYVNTFAETQG